MMSFLGRFFPSFARPSSRREELTELLQESLDDKTSFDSHEGTLLQNFLGLRDITAADVMIPRADIVSVALADGFDDIIRQMSDANHSRVPVYRNTLDDVVGIIHIKDLFAHLRNGHTPGVESLLRPALFISPTILLLDLLHEMRLRRRHLALVVDEFGGVDGLITIEDLVEEIVGEIEDEHDTTAQLRFEQKGDGTAIADARLEVEVLEAITGPLLDDDERDEIDTLGGLVCALAGRVPGRGEVVRHRGGIQFEILEGDPRRVTLLKLRGLPRVKTSSSKQD
jgi:magnesium and cobalt transporter